MKGSQVVRVLNARGYLGHRCWRFNAEQVVMETLRECRCGEPYVCLDGHWAVAYVRYLRGEIEQQELGVAFRDERNRPE